MSATLSPLFAAVANDDFGLVKKLIRSGEDVNCASGPRAGFGFSLVQNTQSIEMLHLLLDAGLKCDVPVFLDLINGGMKCRVSTYEGAKLLIDRGVPVNGVRVGKKNGYYADSPLDWAIVCWHVDAVRALIDAGADANCPHGLDGWRPIHYAAKYFADNTSQYVKKWGKSHPHKCSEEIVELLLKHGADINGRRLNGNTPLLDAVRKCVSAYSVDFLIAHGADPFLHNREGLSVLLFKERYCGPQSTKIIDKIIDRYYATDPETGEIRRRNPPISLSSL